MLACLIATAAGAAVSVAPSGFDLADLRRSLPVKAVAPHRRSPYRALRLEEPTQATRPIRVKLRWRKVRVTMPVLRF